MDYIDRKALRDALYDADAITVEGVKILNQFPSADVSPVLHGRWKWNFDCGLLWCSACGWNIEEDVSDYAYCPSCGAKMDGVNDG